MQPAAAEGRQKELGKPASRTRRSGHDPDRHPSGSGGISRRAGFGFPWGLPAKESRPVLVQIRPTARLFYSTLSGQKGIPLLGQCPNLRGGVS